MLFPGDGIDGIKRFFLDVMIAFGKRGLACQPAIVGIGLGGSKDTCMTLGKQAACLRVVGDRHPDARIAELESELTELGNSIGMGAMGFAGSSMVLDCHIEVGYTHTGGMPISVHSFCLSSRRATARLHPDGRTDYRSNPHWFTPYLRRDGIEWPLPGENLKTVRLTVPLSAQTIAGLAIGTVVYLDGLLYSCREAVYKRIIEEGIAPPTDLAGLGNVNFHCSPAASADSDGSFRVGAVTATASFRFAKWLPRWFELTDCRAIIGKGGMSAEHYRDIFVPAGAIYLTTVGYGTGALLGRAIERVENVWWLDELGIAQALWLYRVRNFGPLLVESDLHGRSLFETNNAAINENIERLYQGLRKPALSRFGETDDKKQELI